MSDYEFPPHPLPCYACDVLVPFPFPGHYKPRRDPLLDHYANCPVLTHPEYEPHPVAIAPLADPDPAAQRRLDELLGWSDDGPDGPGWYPPRWPDGRT